MAALRAYRYLAFAVGPVIARATMREIRDLPGDEAIARIVTLHVELARSRDDTIAALHALDGIVEERSHDAPPAPADVMSISELSAALGVRSSTLRFWEHQGLLTPDREEPLAARRYPPDAVRDARIVAALRAGGYRIPAVQSVMTSLRALGDTGNAREALRDRLQTIASRSAALLRAGTDIVEMLKTLDPHDAMNSDH
ncbi:DNA-binding transcriptional MerR regulator [Leifsonia sp. AK011]|uniref:MerR family transcriptional regulator n=1 Tax=Leifsonia sp. AK011 TaxID=2723075 RepID=UPI0017C940D4|nr:MerR family transcriptional regulator [Leifsonia sp. AK011]NYF10622.1 DNA-binding transcriptional MerR regulator [Leifsonia sp. AK011]